MASQLEDGAVVECRYQTGNEFFPGRIKRAHLSGKYDIIYDDGDEEENVERRKIKLKGQKQRAQLTPGEKVDARHPGSDKVLPAEVVEVRQGNVYSVRFDESGETEDVKRAFILPNSTIPPTSPPARLARRRPPAAHWKWAPRSNAATAMATRHVFLYARS